MIEFRHFNTQTNMKRKKRKEKQLHLLYNKYEHLADEYARKMFNVEEIGFEREDMMQEFRLKLFEVIIAYAKQFGKFLDGERDRPPVIDVYLKLAMSNKKADMIKMMKQNKHNGWSTFLSVERDDFDYSIGSDIHSELSKIVNFKISKYKGEGIEINGIDILDGIEDRKERMAFIMHLKGYKMKEIDSILKLKSGKIIRPQLERLGVFEDTLLDITKHEVTVYNIIED